MTAHHTAARALLAHIDKCQGYPRKGCVFADDPAVLALRAALDAEPDDEYTQAAVEYAETRIAWLLSKDGKPNPYAPEQRFMALYKAARVALDGPKETP